LKIEFTQEELNQMEHIYEECTVKTDQKYLYDVKKRELFMLLESKKRNKIREDDYFPMSDITDNIIENIDVSMSDQKLLRSKSNRKLDIFYELSQTSESVNKSIKKK